MRSGVAYRERATECLRIASAELDATLKAKWTKIAAEWEALAERMESDLKPEPVPNK
jgi:hypothetical protein